jgi:hypothetical protein
MRVSESVFERIPWYLTSIIAGIVYFVTLAFLPPDYFWIADNDSKFLQVEAVRTNGLADLSINWPGAMVDKEFRFNPLPAPFSVVSGGKLYPVFSPVFAIVSSIPFSWFGFRGLYLLPLLGGVLILLGIARICFQCGSNAVTTHSAVFMAGLAGPIWFYSVLFWEHTIAGAFALWAVSGLISYAGTPTKRRLVFTGIAAALAVYFRDELYLFCAVLVFVAWRSIPASERMKTIRTMAGVMVMTFLPLWLFQWVTIGQPFGFHLGMHLFSGSGIAAYILSRPKVIYSLFFAIHPNIIVSLMVTLPWMILLFLPERLIRNHAKLLTGAAITDGLALVAVGIAGFATTASPIVWLLKTNSLLAASPILVLAAVPDLGESGKGSGRSLVRLVAVLYLVAYAFAAPELGSTGIHWGNRFVLVIYPLLAVLAASTMMSIFNKPVRFRTAMLTGIALLVAISLIAQIWSVSLIGMKKDFNRRLTEAVRTRPELTVISDVWWTPLALSRVFSERRIYYTPNNDEMQNLGKLLAGNGTTAVLYITSAGTRPVKGAIRIDDSGLEFFSLDLIPLTLRPARAPSY